jgi:hypothetical protein
MGLGANVQSPVFLSSAGHRRFYPASLTSVVSWQVLLRLCSILVALLVGAELFGVFGMIISVPLAATVKILMQEFVLPPLKALADEEPEDEVAPSTE